MKYLIQEFNIEDHNIFINSKFIKKQTHCYTTNSTLILFNYTSNIIWFIKSNECEFEEHIFNIAKNKSITFDYIKIYVNTNIICNLYDKLVLYGYKYIQTLSDSSIILSYYKDDFIYTILYDLNEYRSKSISLSKEVIEKYYEYTKLDYEIANNLIEQNNKLIFGNYVAVGDKYTQSVSPVPYKYIIHSHLSMFYDKYNLFMSMFSLGDIKYLLTHQNILHYLYVSSKEGIYTININDTYRGKLSSNNINDICNYISNNICKLDNDDKRYLDNKNINKLHKIFDKYINLTGKSVMINSVYNDTSIFNISLDTWISLNCNICV